MASAEAFAAAIPVRTTLTAIQRLRGWRGGHAMDLTPVPAPVAELAAMLS
jgi:hypothetical protein